MKCFCCESGPSFLVICEACRQKNEGECIEAVTRSLAELVRDVRKRRGRDFVRRLFLGEILDTLDTKFATFDRGEQTCPASGSVAIGATVTRDESQWIPKVCPQCKQVVTIVGYPPRYVGHVRGEENR